MPPGSKVHTGTTTSRLLVNGYWNYHTSLYSSQYLWNTLFSVNSLSQLLYTTNIL
jgi:hypothetical protein